MKRTQRRLAFSAALIIATCTAWTPVWADDVEDALNEAMAAYKQKDYQAASEALSFADTLIRQKTGNVLEGYLPKPLDGWTADEAESSAAGAAMFGGGVGAQRVYVKGDKRVTVSLITDSPMLSGMMMMMGNPMFASSSGGKLQRIKGQKAMVKPGEITMAINNTLVTVNGEADQDDLVAYAEGVDIDSLKNR